MTLRTLQQVLRRQELRDRFFQLGIDPVGTSPEEFTQFLRDEVAKWGKVIRAANVKVEG